MPVHEVAGWPQRVIDLYAAFLSVEPAPEERIEYALAQLSALVVNRTRGAGEQPQRVADMLMFASPWQEKLSTLDAQIGSRLDSLGRKQKE